MEWRRFVADYEQDAPLVYKFCQGFRLPNGLHDGSVRSEAQLHR
ncbi:hypothetical protein [Kingella oralis]|nr:hypothetical protein [Kingella oralis]